MLRWNLRFTAIMVCILFVTMIFANDSMSYALAKNTTKGNSSTEYIESATSMGNKQNKVKEPVLEEPVVEEPVVQEPVTVELESYYVANDGSDLNPGTMDKPWATIQKAAESVAPGDTVYIRGGVYNERVVLKKSGTVGQYITFANYPGEEVIIDGEGIDWGYNWSCLFNLNKQSYIKIKGLKVINSRWVGIGSLSDTSGSSNVIIQECSTYNTMASGIGFMNSRDIVIEGNSVENANTADAQEAISLETVNNFIVKNNLVFNSPREGIDVKNGCTNGKIFGNTVHDVVKVGIYVDAYSKHQYDIEVYNNTVYNCEQGITVATENSGLLENINIYDNTIKNCVWGMAIGGWDEGNTHAMKGIIFNNNNVTSSELVSMYLGNNEVENIQITNNFLNGIQTSNPIYLVEGVDISKITIDGNALNMVVKASPTGTNYTII